MKLTIRQMLLPVAMVAVMVSCGGGAAVSDVQTDPLSDSFYEIARFIMFDDEIDIFLHLPNAEAKRQFIDEFWQKRDPDPTTEENEFKKEFESRIAFANRWFREGGRKGWDTERGRIFLVLGFPNRRDYGSMVSPEYFYRRFDREIPRAIEIWEYVDYQMELIFVDMKGFGDFKLEAPPAQLGSSMELAKSSALWNPGKDLKNRLTFSVEFKDDRLLLSVPLKRITFQKEGEVLRAKLRVSVDTYHNYQKKESKTIDFDISEKEETLLGKKEWPLVFPLSLTEKGKYVFEILLSDVKGGAAILKYHRARL